MAPPDELIQPVPDEQAVIEAYKRFAELLKSSRQLIIFAEAHSFDITHPTCLLLPTSDLEFQLDKNQGLIISSPDNIRASGTVFGSVENLSDSYYGDLTKLCVRLNDGKVTDLDGKNKVRGSWAPSLQSMWRPKSTDPDENGPSLMIRQIKLEFNGNTGIISYKLKTDDGSEFDIITRQAAGDEADEEDNTRGFLLLDDEVLQADGIFIHPDLRDLNIHRNLQISETYYGMAPLHLSRRFQATTPASKYSPYGAIPREELNTLIGENWRPVQWGWDFEKNIQYIYAAETSIKELPLLLGQKQTKLLTGTDIAGQKKEYGRVHGSY